jgi:hypothetical protein
MSSEYAMGGAFSIKSDTYSFGVLILEIVSGSKISSAHHLIMDFSNLISYVSTRRYSEFKTIHKRQNVISECEIV